MTNPPNAHLGDGETQDVTQCPATITVKGSDLVVHCQALDTAEDHVGGLHKIDTAVVDQPYAGLSWSQDLLDQWIYDPANPHSATTVTWRTGVDHLAITVRPPK